MNELELNLIQRINVGDSLTRTSWRYPNKVAIVDGPRQFTYYELNDLVNKFSHFICSLGLQVGDSMALLAGNCAEFLISYFACAKVGVVCVPINLGWKGGEIEYVLNHSGAKAIVIEEQFLKLANVVLPSCEEIYEIVVVHSGDLQNVGDLSERNWHSFEAVIGEFEGLEPEVLIADRAAISYLYTSGTTSAPKGVVSSHLAVYLESLGVCVEDRFSHDDVLAAMMPLFHTAQLNGQCTPAIVVGATIVLLRGFDAEALLSAIEREKVSVFFGLPFMFRELLDCPSISQTDLSSLRLAIYAMAPMPDTLLRQCIEVLGCDFALGFGQTEMNPVTTIFRPEHQLSHSGAVGTPQINVAVAIMDESGCLLPNGSSGEIVYRSPQTMTEYLHNPSATELAFDRGWFHSGDSGYFDKDGILWFEDRFKDVIKSGGENVSSIEVEKAIYASSNQIAEAAVVGLPHGRWGEAITAFVVPKNGQDLDPTEILARVKDKIDGFKAPKSIEIVSELPRTSTGKVQKNLLRRQYSAHYEEK
ncbi:class I adenylate-forming enzyme family protein [Acidithrix ferrooxidans]|uniref:Long-chain-fatty-acid--CoA ligase n=1 Tax=Acidithrix ferrooxidans TaxID=1280514 RepID=A0A0D8HHY8_9ACTN|nr:AMP-binding protein [Acidithrix ferrooxidans]KJF16696.1 long-chain-fatty-acid--CoA ligase [Acidithrix ferrooxidans]